MNYQDQELQNQEPTGPPVRQREEHITFTQKDNGSPLRGRFAAMDLPKLYSENAKNMRRSAIRELLKLTNRPGLISFAGGLPDPEIFPAEVIAEISG